MKSVLFDLDGTLTDSGEGITRCAQLALSHFGIDIPDRNRLRVFVGPPLRESFPRFGVPEDQVEEAIAIFRSRYLTVGKFENAVYPGIPQLLQKLCDRGYHLYVATSKPEDTAVEIMKKFGLDPYFDLICGAVWDGSRDAKEAVIAYLMEQIGSENEAIMIGDTAYDVIGAKAHGIPTIGVSWGYGEDQDMIDAGAVALARDTEELLQMIEAM